MLPFSQDVRPGLLRWGSALLLAALIGLLAVGNAAGDILAAPAGRLAESEVPPEEGEEVAGQESISLPSAPRAARSPASGHDPLRPRAISPGACRSASVLAVRGRPLAVSGLPPALPLRC